MIRSLVKRITYNCFSTLPSPPSTPIMQKVNAVKPHASSFKRRVVFNWNNVKNLRGSEKIDLFRDFARTTDTKNALRIYLIMKENELLPRLTYVDHHKMFHLLLKNRKLYRKEIENLWDWLKQNQYYPSPALYKEMFLCYKDWMDLHNATKLYHEMLEAKIDILDEIYEVLLFLCSKSRDSRNHLEGIKIWNSINQDNLKPFLITMALELFGKLKDSARAADLYKKTYPILPQEGINALKIRTVYLSALVNAEAYAQAHEVYENTVQELDWSSKLPVNLLMDIYRVMIKACYKTHNLSLARKILSDMEFRGLNPDSQIYSRYLVILGVGEITEAENFYETQTLDISSAKTLSRYQVALLEVYCHHLERETAEKHFSLIVKMPFKLYAMNFLKNMYEKLGDGIAEANMKHMIKEVENGRDILGQNPDALDEQ